MTTGGHGLVASMHACSIGGSYAGFPPISYVPIVERSRPLYSRSGERGLTLLYHCPCSIGVQLSLE